MSHLNGLFMSHMDAACRIWQAFQNSSLLLLCSHVTYGWVIRDTRMRHVVAYMCPSCHIRMSHVAHERVFTTWLLLSPLPLQHMSTHYNTLQHTTIRCSTLQHTSKHCNTFHNLAAALAAAAATHVNTLQHTATHYNTLQHTTTHCNTLQHFSRLGCCPRRCYYHVIVSHTKIRHATLLIHMQHDSFIHEMTSTATMNPKPIKDPIKRNNTNSQSVPKGFFENGGVISLLLQGYRFLSSCRIQKSPDLLSYNDAGFSVEARRHGPPEEDNYPCRQ